MKLQLTLTAFISISALTLGLLVFTAMPASAQEVEHHEEHEMHDEVEMSSDSKIEQMQALVVLLTELLELLQQKAMAVDSHTHEDSTVDLDGIHIMANGDVMNGDGEILEGVAVTEDGMIELTDGTFVEPVMDMRPADEESHEEHAHEHEGGSEDEALSIRFEIHDGNTHVHYTDADGELTTFFVDSEVTDEAGVLAEIATELEITEAEAEEMTDFSNVVVWE